MRRDKGIVPNEVFIVNSGVNGLFQSHAEYSKMARNTVKLFHVEKYPILTCEDIKLI